MRELRRRLRADRPLPRFEPCLPRPAKEPPAGPGWIHEIKHDGFRIIARRDAAGVRLITRNGYDLAGAFPARRRGRRRIAGALLRGRWRGHRRRRQWAFGVRPDPPSAPGSCCDPLRLRPARTRRRGFAPGANRGAQAHPQPGYCAAPIRASPSTGISRRRRIVFKHACALGCEGIVSKRLGSPCRSGRAVDRVVRELKKHGVEITEDGVRLMKKFRG